MGILSTLGLQLCFGQADNTEMLTGLRDQVGELCQAVKTWILPNEEVCKFCKFHFRATQLLDFASFRVTR